MGAVNAGPAPFTHRDKKNQSIFILLDRNKHLIENRHHLRIDLKSRFGQIKLLRIIFILVVVVWLILDFKTE